VQGGGVERAVLNPGGRRLCCVIFVLHRCCRSFSGAQGGRQDVTGAGGVAMVLPLLLLLLLLLLQWMAPQSDWSFQTG
jgi:hypothetical protein